MHQVFGKLAYILIKIAEIYVIFTHLKLWVAAILTLYHPSDCYSKETVCKKNVHQVFGKLAYILIKIAEIYVIFTHLKLWVAAILTLYHPSDCYSKETVCKKNVHQVFGKLAYILIKIAEIYVIFTHLKLWVAAILTLYHPSDCYSKETVCKKNVHQVFGKLAYILIKIAEIYVIFTHLKLWVAAATHNLKWVNIYFFYCSV